jgi:hypothetical protein
MMPTNDNGKSREARNQKQQRGATLLKGRQPAALLPE